VDQYTKSERAAITRALNIISETRPEQGEALTSPAITREVAMLEYARQADHTREHFMVAFLNAQHQRISVEVLFSGTIDGAAVYPREVAKRALLLNAAAIVLIHNHPSGTTNPSAADRNITQRITDGLRLLDIRVLDHLIITQYGDSYSFAEHGLI
jgi:DNA repair protein RadC